MVERPALLVGLATAALTKRQEAELKAAEMKTLGFSFGVTKMEMI